MPTEAFPGIAAGLGGAARGEAAQAHAGGRLAAVGAALLGGRVAQEGALQRLPLQPLQRRGDRAGPPPASPSPPLFQNTLTLPLTYPESYDREKHHRS